MHEANTLLAELGDLERLASKRNVSVEKDTDRLVKDSYTLSEKEKAERASDLIRQVSVPQCILKQKRKKY
jgi:hypothetical protein